MRHAMIMAGGSGTRLWPMSRGNTPKQLIGLFNNESLLEIAVARVDSLIDEEHLWICTGQQHSDQICETLQNFQASQVLGEPVGRDTLNAVGFTATILHKIDPDAIFAVLTADHIIEPKDEFARSLEIGFQLVEDDHARFVTFGITPTYPATGYGYVELGDPIGDHAYACKRFVEKPDLTTAEQYLSSGQFSWNSGMFVFHATTFLDALKRMQPETSTGLAEIGDAWGTSNQQAVLDRVYPTLLKTSVDYGIMEPATSDDAISICTVPMNVTWLDVGSWTSYGETLRTSTHDNKSDTKSVHLDSSKMLCISDDPSHTIATIGCHDLVIVHTKDATLVFPKTEAQRVKELHTMVDPSLQ